MKTFLFLNRLPWIARVPAKWIVLLGTVGAVCYPYPRRLVTHWQRIQNPDALINPESPALEPLIAEVKQELTPDLTPPQVLKKIESFVYKKVPYEWDWNTWGVADYFPTVEEALSQGKEDCDGRAIVAASIMRYFGYDARLVTDFAHLWVTTSEGDVMNPGKTKAAVATGDGFQLQPGAFRQLVQPLAYGVSVFPLARELIVIGVLWWLLLGRGVSKVRAMGSLLFLVNGLFLLRLGSDWRHPQNTAQALAAANLLVGVVLPWFGSRAKLVTESPM